MKIKTYVGGTFHEALGKAKSDYEDDIVLPESYLPDKGKGIKGGE